MGAELQALVKLNILTESAQRRDAPASEQQQQQAERSRRDDSDEEDTPRAGGRAHPSRIPQLHRRHRGTLQVQKNVTLQVQKNVVYFSFVNSALQELVYGRMNAFFRSKLHTNLAAYLEKQYEERLAKQKLMMGRQAAGGSTDAATAMALAIESDQNLLAYHWCVCVCVCMCVYVCVCVCVRERGREREKREREETVLRALSMFE